MRLQQCQFSINFFLMEKHSWNVVRVQQRCWACRLTSLADFWAQCVSYIHNSPNPMQSASWATSKPHTGTLTLISPPEGLPISVMGMYSRSQLWDVLHWMDWEEHCGYWTANWPIYWFITQCDAGGNWSSMEVMGSCLICELWTGLWANGYSSVPSGWWHQAHYPILCWPRFRSVSLFFCTD